MPEQFAAIRGHRKHAPEADRDLGTVLWDITGRSFRTSGYVMILWPTGEGQHGSDRCAGPIINYERTHIHCVASQSPLASAALNSGSLPIRACSHEMSTRSPSRNTRGTLAS